MTEEKRNRIVAAITINVILFLVIIVCTITYQIVEISILHSRKQQILGEIAYYQEQINGSQDALEYYQSSDYLLLKAYEYGFVFPGDK